MEIKTARLTLLIDPNKKLAFERLCASQDRTASQVVRQLIRDYLLAHGVPFVGSGADVGDGDGAPPRKAAAPPKPGRQRNAATSAKAPAKHHRKL